MIGRTKHSVYGMTEGNIALQLWENGNWISAMVYPWAWFSVTFAQSNTEFDTCYNAKLNSRGRSATLSYRGRAVGHPPSRRCTASRPANSQCRCRVAARPPSRRSNSTLHPVDRRSRMSLRVRFSCRSSIRRCTTGGRLRRTRAVLGRVSGPSGIHLCTNCRPAILWRPCPRECRRLTVPVDVREHFSLSVTGQVIDGVVM